MILADDGIWHADGLPPRRVHLGIPRGPAPWSLLIAHDAQNLFYDHHSFSGVAWDLLRQLESCRPTLLVALDNTHERLSEYDPAQKGKLYVDFLADHVQGSMMRRFPLSLRPQDHFLIGSSMGGIISAFAVCQRPHQFGGAACLSTHWPASHGHLERLLPDILPDPGWHRWYFDHGTEGIDAPYQAYQKKVDGLFEARGYRRGQDFQSLVFPGSDHCERDWRQRLHIPLEFLLKP